jgi:hypothetical protein
MGKDCYSCKFRGTVPGSTHSRCNAIIETVSDKAKGSELEMLLATHQVELQADGKPIVNLDPHGVKSGWANWPLDFDPTWVSECLWFSSK